MISQTEGGVTQRLTVGAAAFSRLAGQKEERS